MSCIGLISATLVAGASWSAEWQVEADGSGDFPTIQAAFDGASAGDVIMLGPGTYNDVHTRSVTDWLGIYTTSAIAFMKPGVDIVGVSGAELTILDGEGSHHGLVGTDLGDVEIRGISFEDCSPTGTGGLVGLGGAGCIVFRSRPTVEACIFRRCIAPEVDVDGASGLYIVQGSDAVVRDNLFVDNYGGDIGGAAGILQHSNALVELNTFVNNAAGDGGGAIEVNQSVLIVRNNIFAFNTAANIGGAFLCLNGASVTASCNLFWENDAPSGPHVSSPSCLPLGLSENVIADPLFCDPGEDVFTIQSNSPAAPEHPSGCGLRGAYPVGCGAVTIEATSWGSIKGRYAGD